MAAANRELLIGIDFAGPAGARDQRRKILAVAAQRTGIRQYSVAEGGFNARLLQRLPGWTAEELANELTRPEATPSIVGADFPFCVPRELLEDDSFAAAGGVDGPFANWKTFNSAVCRQVNLECPVDYASFHGWRQKRFWLKRASDRVSGAHPPLKDRFQVLFNMTLLGNAFLARLAASGKYDIVPFHARDRARVIEVYPGHAMRVLGVPGYKRAPARAIETMIDHLKQREISLELNPDIRNACVTYNTGRTTSDDHDAADAFVALCIAVLHREGAAREVLGPPADARDIKGAIWSVAAERVSAPGPRAVRRRTPKA